MGAFASLAYLGSSRREVNDVDELAGLARSQPLVAGALAVCLLSLAGLPPLAGFWGKLSLFGSAIQLATAPLDKGLPLWFTVLAAAGALNAAVAAAYYLRVIAVMFFNAPAQPLAAAGGRPAWLAAVVCSVLVVLSGALPGRLLESATKAEDALRPAAKATQTAHVAPDRQPQPTIGR